MSLWLGWLRKHSLCLTLNLHFFKFFYREWRNFCFHIAELIDKNNQLFKSWFTRTELYHSNGVRVASGLHFTSENRKKKHLKLIGGNTSLIQNTAHTQTLRQKNAKTSYSVTIGPLAWESILGTLIYCPPTQSIYLCKPNDNYQSLSIINGVFAGKIFLESQLQGSIIGALP